MLRVLLLFIFSTSLQYGQEQENYFILHVKGEIENTTTGKLVETKTKISSTDQLRFKSRDAMAAVMSPAKGRFYLKYPDDTKKADEEWLVLLKDAIFPATLRASTRAGSLLNRQDFVNTFSNKKTIVSSNTRFEIPQNLYPLSENHFFYIQYNFRGVEINKKLSYDKEWLIFDKNQILQIDGIEVNEQRTTDYLLFYLDADKELSTLMSDFTPVYIEFGEIIALYNTLGEVYSSELRQREELQNVLQDMYGAVSMATIEQWLTNEK